MTELKDILLKKYEEFSKEFQDIVNRESALILEGTRSQREALSILAKEQVDLIHNFVKENNLKLVELNTAWVTNSDYRRRFTHYKKDDFISKSFKNLTDKEFANKFNSGKGDTLFIKSSFWGPDYMCLL